ncbi:MAG: hypothetical protein ACRCWM_06735 [Sarcina sp.]
MKKLFCLGLISVAMLSFVACGGSDKDVGNDDKKPEVEDTQNDDKDDADENEDEDEADKETNDEDNSDDADEEKPSAEGNNPSTDKKPSENDKEPVVENDKTERKFEILTMDVDYKTVVGGEVKTVGLGVADNIKKILPEVSNKYFDKKPITLTTIETVGKKKIAVVDLGGEASYWNDKFQGSAGGKITEYTLVENVLQRAYNGYWIDGVRFTMNGKKVEDNGHIPGLATTSYRI